jgi:hypothetical protein
MADDNTPDQVSSTAEDLDEDQLRLELVRLPGL